MKRKQQSKPCMKGAPVFIYTSVCCSIQAEKPPCLKVDKKAAETNSLGSWRCTGCRKPCSVTRRKNKLDEKAETQ